MPGTGGVGVGQALERLGDRLRLARQVDDQRLAADHRDLARQDRGRHEAQADRRICSPKPGISLVGDGERRLGRHVARRRAGAAGGEDQVAARVVDQLAQRRADRGLSSAIRRVSQSIGLRSARASQSRSAGMPLSS